MNFKDKLNQIKVVLGLEIKLEQMTLEDGVTVVEAEAFEPEYSVGIVTTDEAGNSVIVPMPVGEYTTQDGKVIVVEQEGIIAMVCDATTEEAMPEQAHPSAEATEPQMAQEPQMKKVVETISKETFFSEIEALKTENENLKLELSKLKEVKVELAVEEEVKAIQHNPEAKESAKLEFKMASNRARTTQDVVFSKLF